MIAELTYQVLMQELELLSPSVTQSIGALPPLAPASQGLFDVLGSTAQIVSSVAKGAGQGALPAGIAGRRLLQVLPHPHPSSRP